MFLAVCDGASAPLRDAMDLACLIGQWPVNALKMTEHDLIDGNIILTQEKTKQPLSILIIGELKALLARIEAHHTGNKIRMSACWLTNMGND